MNTNNRKKSKKIASYVDLMPPCNNACPAGENIQKWIGLAKEQKFKESWEVIVQNNPFPAIHGRVCYHDCENKCNRSQYDSTVNIHCIERFLGDMAIDLKWQLPIPKTPKTGKKILVVGAGPAGLSAACHLKLLGHEVVIYEALPNAGGMMFTGIPPYRLPRKVLAAEIDRILNLGIKIKYNHKVKDIITEKKQGKFDCVFLAIGAHLGKSLVFPNDNSCLITDAIDYLTNAAFGSHPSLGSTLCVYGGGNTAIDVARTAKRLGTNNVTIIYHRTKDKMSAFAQEIDDALNEGIKFEFLRSVISINNKILSLSINELDDKGRAKPTAKTENLKTDSLVLALGQTPDSDFLRTVPCIEIQTNNVITVDKTFMTGHNGIFAGGDMIPYDRSVTFAVGQGKQAARNINAHLNSTVFNSPHRHELAAFEKLHIQEPKSSKIEQKTLDINKEDIFKELVCGISKNGAILETNRCFSCGNCFECDRCYIICPVKAIEKLGIGKRYKIEQEKCIGCAKCVNSCPCGAITMIDRNLQ